MVINMTGVKEFLQRVLVPLLRHPSVAVASDEFAIHLRKVVILHSRDVPFPAQLCLQQHCFDARDLCPFEDVSDDNKVTPVNVKDGAKAALVEALKESQGEARSTAVVMPRVPSSPVATDKTGSVTIAVHVKPGSKQNAITDLTTEAVGVAIAAPPSKGEANTELCCYLAKVLKVKKSEVVLEKGAKSREKTVKILAPVTPEEVLERLGEEAGS